MWRKQFPDPVELAAGCVVAIGNFDGVHAGHRVLLARGRAIADARKVPLVVLSFEPHPRMVLRPDEPLRLLMTPDEKAKALVMAGVEGLAVLPFDKDVAQWSPAQFMEFLRDWLRPVAVCVGANFRFGYKAVGDARLLAEQGFEVEVVPLLEDAGGVVSSSRLREKSG